MAVFSTNIAGNAGLVLALLCVSGCGNSNSLGRVPVRGTVTLDGAPLDFGSIAFLPKDKAPTSSGAVIVQGAYSIPESKGLPPGEYQVRIHAPLRSPDMPEDPEGLSGPAQERIAPEFNVQTTLSVRISAEGVAICDFQTTSASSR